MTAEPTLATSALALATYDYWCAAKLVVDCLAEGNTAMAAVYLSRFAPVAVGAPDRVQRLAAPRFLSLNTALQRALADEVA